MTIHRQSVLIVDDNPENIEVLSASLGDEVEVLFATTGKDALELARTEQPDLILLDVMMPDMDGYRVCSELKSLPETIDIPVIFVTALSQEEEETRGLDAGAIDYVTKPISPPIVRARVRNHLELKRYRDVLRRLSAVDGLTGIANRRRFDEVLEAEWRRAQRTSSPLSMILCDIDHFKAYNDASGHLLGDECLRRVALALAAGVRRPADLVARWGGEEFACILPDTDHDGATKLAEKLRASVVALNLPHEASPTAPVVTASLGVATLIPTADLPPHDLVQLADDALYYAKKAGRNRVSGPVGE
ncbi:response regulator receiver modulated diguanylate cyclase [Desulfovibrio sp. X2]|uniref:diguanylate cyclase domain-containing protein n=1 Tax=Desulfovibrio sp. X2 TaxID=941449 RepID=UPI000358C4F6|nr:diguanylate cyclase [Desulfovibrio sp. X2]EPR41072.1 response regulator receiver modulated diguanylate cyclase [Desulfovibrio sp. X2]